MNAPAIRAYPDEPHPDGEHQWKRRWIAKFFDPQQPLFSGDLQWVHRCWLETKARFCAPNDKDEGRRMLDLANTNNNL